jgi:hypothetical protein
MLLRSAVKGDSSDDCHVEPRTGYDVTPAMMPGTPSRLF